MHFVEVIILGFNYDYLIIIDFYAKHLQALKDAGIMTNISDPNATEMRGWVMLMLERAAETVNPSECNDPAVLLACSLGSDSCPAACQKDSETKTDENGNVVKVKSGDLSVSAERNEGVGVITNGATSELDTLKFQASEEITLKSVTLERYGMSKYNSIASIWLEDQDGNKITQEKTISQSKDTVTLSIKKDYQSIEDWDSVVVVVTTPNPSTKADLGTNIWFKVTAVESSAKNLNLSNYSANLYDIVDYAGTDVKVDYKGSDKTYNYVEGNAYEVAKVKLTASNAAILVNGLTLTQDSTLVKNMDLSKFVDEVLVSVDGKEINAKSSVKRDEIKLSFDGQEIAINKSSTFTVSVTLKDFDDLGSAIKLWFKSSSDVDIIESKNKVRVAIWNKDESTTTVVKHSFEEKYGNEYTFMWGKITLTNEKLSSTIDAAAGSDDVVVAKGKIAIWGQAVSIKTLKVEPTTVGATNDAQYVDSLRLLVGDEEYEADKNWNFNNVVIEEDATIKLVADIIDLKAGDENKTITISFTVAGTTTAAFNKTTWANIKYDDINTNAAAKDNLIGTINISSIKVQPAKWSLTNDNTKKVEFITNETSEETLVFKGTYSAKKSNVKLDNVAIWRTSTAAPKTADDITFNVKVDGKTVATIDNPKAADKFENAKDDSDISPVISVEAGKSVNIEVYAVVFASEETAANLEYKIGLKGKDDAGNDAGNADKAMAPMSFVGKSTINVVTNDTMKKQDIVLANKNQNLATFNVKSSNTSSTAKLESLLFDVDDNLLSLIPTNADPEDYFEVAVWTDSDHTYALNRTAKQLEVSDINTDIKEATKIAVNFKEKLTAKAPVPAGAGTCTVDGVKDSSITSQPACTAAAVAGVAGVDPVCKTATSTTPQEWDVTVACPTNGSVDLYTVATTTTSWEPYVSTAKVDAVTAVVTSWADDPNAWKPWEAIDYTITLRKVNNWTDFGLTNYKYTRTAVNSFVKVVSMQGDKTSQTKYRFDIKYSDDADNQSINEFKFTFTNDVPWTSSKNKVWSNLQAENTYTVDNGTGVNNVTSMSWTDADGYVTTLNYAGGEDYFKVKVWDVEDRIKAYKDSN